MEILGFIKSGDSYELLVYGNYEFVMIKVNNTQMEILKGIDDRSMKEFDSYNDVINCIKEKKSYH